MWTLQSGGMGRPHQLLFEVVTLHKFYKTLHRFNIKQP